MARQARDERLDNRTARLKLKPRREPYWRNIQEGRAIGYRRLASGVGGSWIARHYEAADGRRYHAIGSADDLMEADGASTLTFSQAQGRAREWFQEIERSGGRVVEPSTVAMAITAYLEDYKARSDKATRDLKSVINAHILPTLGEKLISTLTSSMIRTWHQKIAASPARLRSKATAKKPNLRAADKLDDNAKRARRATANRILTVLKAALNLAYREGRVASDDAWRRVQPFPKVDAARVRYLTDAESVRLVNACPADFRQMVTAALLTACRYSELAALKARDFDPDAAVLHIRAGKSGKARSVVLGAEAMRFFTSATTGKPRETLLFTHGDAAWGKSHQFRPIAEACAAAQIAPAINFHILWHTFASRFARQGVPMTVIAAALGNSEAICAKHYAHLAPGYVADAIRAAAGNMGIVPVSNVEQLQLATPKNRIEIESPANVANLLIPAATG